MLVPLEDLGGPLFKLEREARCPLRFEDDGEAAEVVATYVGRISRLLLSDDLLCGMATSRCLVEERP